MDKEQIIALAEKADETATQYLQCAGEYHPDYHSVRDEHFYHAAISAYKAELLKEVGEPVAFMCSDEELCHKGYERFSRHNSGEWNIPIFTSDQLAAAILKATKPLEDQIAKVEQRVAEACGELAYAELDDPFLSGHGYANRVSEAIRSGEWRKFVKEV